VGLASEQVEQAQAKGPGVQVEALVGHRRGQWG
jgi:hypothetical protein